MSRPVKELMMNDYQRRFADVDNALVVDVRGIDGNENNAMRVNLHEKGIRVAVVKNTLARKAFKGTTLEAIEPALVFGADSVVEVAREMIDWAKRVNELDLKGACLEGQFFEGEEGVKRLSEFPTKEEAQAKIVAAALGPGSRVVGAAKAPGSNVLAIIKEIEDRLEKGEEIKKAG
jgi:large subunit ribosomal protein L10